MNSLLTEEDVKLRYITPALLKAGWTVEQILMERYFTDGRIVRQGHVTMRRKGNKADYLLHTKDNYPIAIVEAKDGNQPVSGGLQQAIDYALKLDVPFAFSSNGTAFREHDLTTGMERTIGMDEFPTPEELKKRYDAWKGLSAEAQKAVDEPFYYSIDSFEPRYYQRIAINRTVEAVASGKKRLLLVMATGTGKTYTAFQIIHRLHHSGLKKKILYLADRNALIDQTMTKDFKPFKSVMTKVQQKNVQAAFEIHMSLYGQLVDYEDGARQPYEDFAPDFFDLIIVDECHRGSVRKDSEWRKILDYFSPATQIGLTATPRDAEGASNIDYFCSETNGEPLYTYTLKQGIEDGFLAPYRITQSFLSIDLEGWRPEPDELDLFEFPIEQRLYTQKDFGRTLAIQMRRKIVAWRITNMLREIGRMTKTIVFCPDQEEAAEMRDLLVEMNTDMMKRDPRYVMRITSDDREGKKQLDNFLDDDEKYPTVVTTSELLSTGVDCKMCGLVVFDKEVENKTLFKQMLGRGTRLNTGKGKWHFEVLDFRNVTKIFEDPDFDDIADDTCVYRPLTDKPPTVETPVDEPPETDDPSKYHINGNEVKIDHETVKFLGTDGKLHTESIKDFTRKAIQGKYAKLDDFLSHWTEAERKSAIIEELKECDVPVLLDAVIEENPALADKDVFDIILHVAYDQKPLTRRERAENVKKRNYLAKYEGKAREVLAALLDKYADRGVLELENDDTLELKPFSDIGNQLKIVRLFGGADKFDAALQELESEIYREAN